MRNSSRLPLDFIGYIETLRVTDTVEGMFIEDAQRDLNLANARNWKELKDYFDTFEAGVRGDFYPVARKIWRRYRRLYPAYLEPNI